MKANSSAAAKLNDAWLAYNAVMSDDRPKGLPPKPTPPEKPLPTDCCGSGCDPCVLDVYADAEEKYREALKHWEKRFAAVLPPRD